MAAHTLVEIRCDGCDEAQSEWNVTMTWFRKFLREEEQWATGRSGDYCPRCADRNNR